MIFPIHWCSVVALRKSRTSKDSSVIFLSVYCSLFDFQNAYACSVTAVINSTERRWVIRISSILLLPKKASLSLFLTPQRSGFPATYALVSSMQETALTVSLLVSIFTSLFLEKRTTYKKPLRASLAFLWPCFLQKFLSRFLSLSPPLLILSTSANLLFCHTVYLSSLVFPLSSPTLLLSVCVEHDFLTSFRLCCGSRVIGLTNTTFCSCTCCN